MWDYKVVTLTPHGPGPGQTTNISSEDFKILHYTHLQSERCLVVSIWDTTLLHSSVSWQGSLNIERSNTVSKPSHNTYLYVGMPRFGVLWFWMRIRK